MRGLPDVLKDVIGGRSQRSVAEAVGVSEGAVSHWLAGRHAPDRDDVVKLLAFCGASPNQEREVFGHFVPPDVLAEPDVIAARRAAASHGSTSSVPDVPYGPPTPGVPSQAATVDNGDDPTEDAPLECIPAMVAAGWKPRTPIGSGSAT